jgi:5-methyltetrahydrofolate--homocysteine methyltransferase
VSGLAPGTLLDGGLATGLYARGMPGEALPEEWVLTHPEDVAAVHAGHARAGARIVLAATFNLVTPRLAARVGSERDELVAATAVGLARAAAPGASVAGSLGPTAVKGATHDLVATRYEVACRALAAAGADLAWIETQLDLGEALAAIQAAGRAGLPAVVTFAFREEQGRLVGGEGVPAEVWLSTAAALGAVAVGVNCVAATPALARVAFAARALSVPFVVKPSPGPPGDVATPEAFARAVAPVVDAGARIVGGCCGAGPEHLLALGELLTRSPPLP